MRVQKGAIPGSMARSIGIVVVLLAASWFAIGDINVPHALLTDDSSGLSLDTAMHHVHNMATEPHPAGSKQNRLVRDYILDNLRDSGYVPEVQAATTINRGDTAFYLENIIASKKGEQSTGTVLIVAHYDSVHRGPGAADDLAAVAVMLETARIVSGMTPLNDVVFLFTDGEEIGLKGAREFMEGHPLSSEVSVVLNFEARGVSGPSLMFETGGGNGALVRSLADTPFPVAYSWSDAVYSLMSNDTDFSVFRERGIPGLNFAFIGKGATHYHRVLDTAENLDPGSLAHHGSYMGWLATSLSQLNLAAIEEQNRVYFRLPGMLVHYQYRIMLPIAISSTVLFSLVCVFGFSRKRLQVLKMLAGILSLPLMLATASGLVNCAWLGIQYLHPQYYATFMSGGYSAPWYQWAFSLLAILTCVVLIGWLEKRIGGVNLFAGILLNWCAGSFLTVIYLPGMSYMFAWPLLFGSCSLLLLTLATSSFPYLLMQVILTLPVILLTAPGVVLVFEAMGLNMAFASTTILLVLMISMMVPLVKAMRGPGRNCLSGVLALLVVAALIGGSFSSQFDAEHPQPVYFRYHLDLNQDRGMYVVGKGVDVGDWLPMHFEPVDREDYPSDFLSLNYMVAPAPVHPAEGARITLVDVEVDIGTDSSSFLLRLDRGASYWGMLARIAGNKVTAAWLDGKPLRLEDGQLRLRLQSFPPQGYLLKIETNDREVLVIDTMTWRGLEPGLVPSLPERPASMVPHGDLLTVEKKFTIDYPAGFQ